MTSSDTAKQAAENVLADNHGASIETIADILAYTLRPIIEAETLEKVAAVAEGANAQSLAEFLRAVVRTETE